jgi:SAM-dependent methyltransferase
MAERGGENAATISSCKNSAVPNRSATRRMSESPWLSIPSVDYERHMAEVGQADALRKIFARIYAETAPRRVLVLGCTTGQDLALVDAHVTERAVGVDLNREYLEAARIQVAALGTRLDLIHGDVLTVDLGAASFDLIHAALLLEYVDPSALLERIREWLAIDGVCCIVSQNAVDGVAPVSRTAYESLRSLDGRISLIDRGRVHAAARAAGLEPRSANSVNLPGGKSFSVTLVKRPSR